MSISQWIVGAVSPWPPLWSPLTGIMPDTLPPALHLHTHTHTHTCIHTAVRVCEGMHTHSSEGVWGVWGDAHTHLHTCTAVRVCEGMHTHTPTHTCTAVRVCEECDGMHTHTCTHTAVVRSVRGGDTHTHVLSDTVTHSLDHHTVFSSLVHNTSISLTQHVLRWISIPTWIARGTHRAVRYVYYMHREPGFRTQRFIHVSIAQVWL